MGFDRCHGYEPNYTTSLTAQVLIYTLLRSIVSPGSRRSCRNNGLRERSPARREMKGRKKKISVHGTQTHTLDRKKNKRTRAGSQPSGHIASFFRFSCAVPLFSYIPARSDVTSMTEHFESNEIQFAIYNTHSILFFFMFILVAEDEGKAKKRSRSSSIDHAISSNRDAHDIIRARTNLL